MQNNGFTIIELVIAIFVLTLGVIGIYSAFSVMAVATSQISERFVASYLVQEGIEVVRNMRDTNWTEGGEDWLADICESSECSFVIDYKTTTDSTPFQPWTEGGDTGKLFINSDGFYDHGQVGQKTGFSRKIKIEPIENGAGEVHAAKVTVTVFWQEKPTIINPLGNPGKITAEEYLYNWY